MKIAIILVTFFTIAYSTNPIPTGNPSNIKKEKSSVFSNIQKLKENGGCVKEMVKHAKKMKNLWNQVDETMEKKTKNCQDYGGNVRIWNLGLCDGLLVDETVGKNVKNCKDYGGTVV